MISEINHQGSKKIKINEKEVLYYNLNSKEYEKFYCKFALGIKIDCEKAVGILIKKLQEAGYEAARREESEAIYRSGYIDHDRCCHGPDEFVGFRKVNYIEIKW